jgi:lysophospholipase L1-like esterase
MKSDSSTTYKTNLQKYLTDAKAKSVTPVLITPVSRSGGAGFASTVDGVALDQTMRDLATAQNVALVDLTKLSSAYYGTLSSSAKSALFVDGTHFHEPGATQIANLVAQALKGMTTGMEVYVR